MHPPHRRNSAPSTLSCATTGSTAPDEAGPPSSPHLLYYSRLYKELNPPPDPTPVFVGARRGATSAKQRVGGGGRELEHRIPAMYMDRPSLLAEDIQSNRPFRSRSTEAKAQFSPELDANLAVAPPVLNAANGPGHTEEDAVATLERRLNDLQTREQRRPTTGRSFRNRISRRHSMRNLEPKTEQAAPEPGVPRAETAAYNRKLAEDHIDEWYESAHAPTKPTQRPPLARKTGSATKIASLHRGKFRPSTAPLPSTVKDDDGRRHQFLDHILDDHIENYDVVRAVAEKPLPPMARDRVPIEDYGLVAETNFDRLKHAFHYQRYQKQAEMEDFLVWRRQCQQVVEGKVAAKAGKQTPNDRLIREMIEPNMNKNGTLKRTQRSSGGESHLHSIWTAKAYGLAVNVEKDRLCEELEHFCPPENAAQLSIKAVNTMRTQLIRFIKAEPCDFSKPPLSRERFFKFLTMKGYAASEVSRSALVTGDETELVDLMTSPAEAAFVHYVLTCIK